MLAQCLTQSIKTKIKHVIITWQELLVELTMLKQKTSADSWLSSQQIFWKRLGMFSFFFFFFSFLATPWHMELRSSQTRDQILAAVASYASPAAEWAEWMHWHLCVARPPGIGPGPGPVPSGDHFLDGSLTHCAGSAIKTMSQHYRNSRIPLCHTWNFF